MYISNFRIKFILLIVIALLAVVHDTQMRLHAAPTPEQRKELSELKKELTEIIAVVKKKEFDAADKQLKDLELKLNKLVKDAGFQETDPGVTSTRRAIELQLGIISKQQGGDKNKADISFMGDVAPILNANCMGCHDNNNPRAGLKLNTFANMKRGGQSGLLLQIGKPQLSLLVARISVRGPNQMPKDKDPLSREEIQTISDWIQQGAKFDGGNENLTLPELIKKHEELNIKPVNVVKATGNEKISFKKDVAPMLVNVCGGCHNEQRKSGGLSLSTFESMLRGGDSGEVLIAGDAQNSRMYRLVMQIEQPKMPPGQALVKRSQAVALGDWIKEGLKFDGNDSKAPLRSLVPTEEELLAQKLAAMSHEELTKIRLDQSKAQWKKAISSTTPVVIDRKDFVIIGDVPELRLNQVADWAEQSLEKIKKAFNDDTTLVWKGKLAIFVCKDRFAYEEFNLSIEQRDAPKMLHAHTKVTDNFQEAYIALEDVGDTTSAGRADLQFNVVEHITSAYMLAQSTKLPGWLVEGSGMYIAFKEVASKEFSQAINKQAKEAFASLKSPELVFRNGSLSPADVGPAGMAVVTVLMNQAKPAQFRQLIQEFANGSQADPAFQQVYKLNSKAIADKVAGSL